MDEPGRPAPLRVLVVDDCRDYLESLGVLLRLWGHEVRLAEDGPAACALAGWFPDVVLLDIALPGMDGYEVARRLRASLPRGQTLLVSLTGYGQDLHRRRSLEAGCDLHWVKPADPDELERLLACWQRRQAAEPAPPRRSGRQ